jgi:hypothetical protein
MGRALLLVLLGLAGCATTAHRPSWVGDLPKKEGWRYEWGRFKSYRANEAREYALRNAIEQLAYQKGVEVKSFTTMVTTDNKVTATMITDQNVEVNISGVEVVEWYEVPQDPVTRTGWEYYVLVRIREKDLFQ